MDYGLLCVGLSYLLPHRCQQLLVQSRQLGFGRPLRFKFESHLILAGRGGKGHHLGHYQGHMTDPILLLEETVVS